MCSVSFLPTRRGYVVAMNRDERRARVLGHPPALAILGTRRALFPSEPSGGTWIGVNDDGVSLALLNWYGIKTRPANEGHSRGQVVRAALAGATADDVARALGAVDLDRTHPFRLIGVFPRELRVLEWRWDLRILQPIAHAWCFTQWFSSGFDEPTAQRCRGRVGQEAWGLKSAGTLPWLRRLHRSHRPYPGPFSTCMHRRESVTVSYTELRVRADHATVHYRPGPACHPLGPPVVQRLPLRP